MSNKLLHTKVSKRKPLNYFPSKKDGYNGDIQIVDIQGKGTYLCVKTKGEWKISKKFDVKNKFDTNIFEEIATKKIRGPGGFVANIVGSDLDINGALTIGSVAVTTSDTNKFLVSDSGVVKYVTGDTLIPDILTAGTNCTFSGATLNVDDAFVKNDADDTMAGTLAITSTTADQFKVLYDASNYALLNVSATGELEIETIGAGTTDSDITLNADGDIILNTAGNNIDFHFTDSGYARFRFFDSTFIILDDSSDPDLDLFSIAVDDNGETTISTTDYAIGGTHADAKLILAPDGILDLQTYGSNGLIFTNGSNKADYGKFLVGSDGDIVFSTVDADAAVAHMTFQPDGDLILDPASQKTIINATDGLYFDGCANTYIHEVSGDKLDTVVGGHTVTEIYGDTSDATGGSDYLAIQALNRLFFDGGGDTYIYEQAADILRLVVGGDVIMHISELGNDGNNLYLPNSCVTFQQLEPTYNASTTTVDFRHSNKQRVTFDGGDISSLAFYFPTGSGNFVLLLKQDGTGSRTVTNWKAYEFDESGADGGIAVKFAGGSNPTLTTDANHVDIISFYWDGDSETAYGVASLDFQD